MSSLDPYIGALEIGSSVSTLLLGICTLQTWNYFRNYGDDPWPIKLFVAVLFAMDVIHSTLVQHAIYHYTVVFFGDVLALFDYTRPLLASILLSGIIIFSVQTFFCIRVLRVTQSHLLAGICFALSLLRFFFHEYAMGRAFNYNEFAVAKQILEWPIVTSLCIGAASDVFIAACLVAALVRRRTGFTSTNVIVDRLMSYILGSGLLTSLVAILEVIVFLTRFDLTWLGIAFTLVKVFTNSLVASLNERAPLRAAASESRNLSSPRRGTVTVGISQTVDVSGAESFMELGIRSKNAERRGSIDEFDRHDGDDLVASGK